MRVPGARKVTQSAQKSGGLRHWFHAEPIRCGRFGRLPDIQRDPTAVFRSRGQVECVAHIAEGVTAVVWMVADDVGGAGGERSSLNNRGPKGKRIDLLVSSDPIMFNEGVSICAVAESPQRGGSTAANNGIVPFASAKSALSKQEFPDVRETPLADF